MKTHFASPERASQEELEREVVAIGTHPIVDGVLQIAGGLIAVLNEHRQLLALNDSFLRLLGVEDPRALLGLRPGEALGCEHADSFAGGCGTTPYCVTCGAAISIVSALASGQCAERDCAIRTLRADLPRDMCFRVRAVPIDLSGKKFVLCFLRDTTRQQSWAALERVFFHDLNNIVLGLQGGCACLVDADREKVAEIAGELVEMSSRLAREIAIQRSLSHGDGGDYQPQFRVVAVSTIIEPLVASFANHPAARGIDLVVHDFNRELRVQSDPNLVMRVLGNMLVNAFEATEPGGAVTLSVQCREERLTFAVWNRATIAPAVALRVFQRNFSSKQGLGRGLGTYSMKFFGESVLGGRVTFSTGPEGTTFRLELPC